MQGKIIKGIAGFYYVRTPVGVFECRAKGIFRKENQKPLVGDDVEVDIINKEEMIGNVIRLLPRKSQMIRPAAANVDQVLAVLAVKDPYPSFQLLDRLLILCRQQNLPCLICLNKQDLDDSAQCEAFYQTYENCGSKILITSTKDFTYKTSPEKEASDPLKTLKAHLAGKTTAIAGPSGVGKSSLINCLQSGIMMETGAISEKIRRGKHTTRHTQLIPIPNLEDADRQKTYILDTPGFSSLDVLPMAKEELADYYPEFAPYEGSCRFQGCSHRTEPDCAVLEAVKRQEIAKRRYDNYCLLYEELNSYSTRNFRAVTKS